MTGCFLGANYKSDVQLGKLRQYGAPIQKKNHLTCKNVSTITSQALNFWSTLGTNDRHCVREVKYDE